MHHRDPEAPGARLVGSAPVLLVRDVLAAEAYYRERLGFEPGSMHGDPPDFCMMGRDGLVVMLAQAPVGHEITPHWRVVDKLWNVYFWVDDARALHDEFRGRGAIIDYGLGVKPYGVLEFGVQDTDGHDIAFGQRL